MLKLNGVSLLYNICKLKRVIIPLTSLIILLAGCSIKSHPLPYVNHAEKNYIGCPNQIDGSRIGYHFSKDIWVIDCDNPLNREYWRVFERDGRAYIIPRPDFISSFMYACENFEPKISELVSKYGLCGEPLDKPKVDRINSMPIVDALLLTHYLHSKLKFKVSNGRVFPFAMPADILAACQIKPYNKKFEKECRNYIKFYGCGKLTLEELTKQKRLGDFQDAEIDCVYILAGVSIMNPEIVARKLNILYGIQ